MSCLLVSALVTGCCYAQWQGKNMRAQYETLFVMTSDSIGCWLIQIPFLWEMNCMWTSRPSICQSSGPCEHMIVGSMFERCGSNRYDISDMKYRQSHEGDGMRRGNIGVVCSCCCTCVIDLYEWTDSFDWMWVCWFVTGAFGLGSCEFLTVWYLFSTNNFILHVGIDYRGSDKKPTMTITCGLFSAQASATRSALLSS